MNDLSLYWVAPGGKINPNRTEVTLVNNATKEEFLIVPTGVRWVVFWGHIENGDNVARDAYVEVEDSSNNVLAILKTQSSLAAGARAYFPNNDDQGENQLAAGCYPFPISPGMRIKYKWFAGGASAGGTCYIVLHVLEVPD